MNLNRYSGWSDPATVAIPQQLSLWFRSHATPVVFQRPFQRSVSIFLRSRLQCHISPSRCESVGTRSSGYGSTRQTSASVLIPSVISSALPVHLVPIFRPDRTEPPGSVSSAKLHPSLQGAGHHAAGPCFAAAVLPRLLLPFCAGVPSADAELVGPRPFSGPSQLRSRSPGRAGNLGPAPHLL